MSTGDGPRRARPGRQALFGPVAAAPEEGVAPGRRAFFSGSAATSEGASDPPATGATRPAAAPSARSDDGVHLTVTCRGCRATTRLPLHAALPRLVLSVWQPFGAYNRRMRCPSCQRIRWCRLDWSEVLELR